MSNIGKPLRIIEVVPVPVERPVTEPPAEAPVPAPRREREKEPVPA